MNATNRGLNRLFLGVTGLLLLAAGAVPILLVTLAPVAQRWRSTARSLSGSAPDWVARPVTGSASALVLGIAAAALVLVVLLLVFVLRRGGGRTGTAVERSDEAGSTRLDLAVPRALLEQHLGARDEFSGVHVAAYAVRGVPVLSISARCRRGVSPADAAELIGRAVDDLGRIVGAELPALVRLSGGFRLGRNTARVA